MKIAKVMLESQSPYSQSKHIDVPKLDNEKHDEYENRTWRERCHVDEAGRIVIPPNAFKGALEGAARWLSMPIKGEGKKTYTKRFEAGIMILEGITLPVKATEVLRETLFVPSDGKPGGGRRVIKHFPQICDWSGALTVHVLDEKITEDVFLKHMEQAGKFIGVGRWRPERRGSYGRFAVKSLEWIDDAV